MASAKSPEAAIVAILNTYSPSTGANIAQVVVRGNGELQIFGDDAMARVVVGKLVNNPLPSAPPATAPGGSRPLKRTRRRQ